jgi:hypothetical protein
MVRTERLTLALTADELRSISEFSSELSIAPNVLAQRALVAIAKSLATPADERAPPASPALKR